MHNEAANACSNPACLPLRPSNPGPAHSLHLLLGPVVGWPGQAAEADADNGPPVLPQRSQSRVVHLFSSVPHKLYWQLATELLAQHLTEQCGSDMLHVTCTGSNMLHITYTGSDMSHGTCT
eukprot:GHRQ01023840.1.p1 GENE.GHRQ01023840.1~~GHRQ01023840.1.p1  ORF type:complete len:136 (+),score=6.42 GHRQ01023840.1:48-410(+)